MRDIARRCGVSQPTVSLSLSNSPLIPEPTRRRIQAAAEKMGYRKNPYVSALMRTRKKRSPHNSGPVLALVDTQPVKGGWRTASATILRQMRLGAVRRARERGYEPQDFWLHQDDMSNARFGDILSARGIRGILVGPSSNHDLVLELDWEQFSSVRLGSAHCTPTLHRVVNDHYQSAMLAVEECHRLGYRRPGLVIEESLNICQDRRWEAGFFIASHHLPDLQLVPSLRLRSISDRSAIHAWVKQYRPDVILDATEGEVLPHLESAGWRVPQEVGLASLASPGVDSPLSGTVQSGENMGATAIDLLIRLIETHETGIPDCPITQSTPSSWNPGHTLLRESTIRARRKHPVNPPARQMATK